MKLLTTLLGRRNTDDDGVALVAAVAVAIIGVAISVIVVTQAISVTNDTARDRLRTLEVHSAESGLDTAMAQLATTSPCPGPSWSPVTVGSGATATTVTVTIKYFNATYPGPDTFIPCTSGVLAQVPTSAVVTSVAVPTNPAPGIDPKRTFEAHVNLVPQTQNIPGAAIFSATTITTGGGFQLLPKDPAQEAVLWLDTGDYDCSTSVQVTGSVYVVDGKAAMKTGCTISGDLWAKEGYENCCAVPTNVTQIGGDLTVRYGNVSLNGRTSVGGDVMVNGTVPVLSWTGNPWSLTTIGGSACAANLPTQCSGFSDYSVVKLPQIDLDLPKWQPTAQGVNFTRKYRDDFTTAMIRSFPTVTASDVNAVTSQPCRWPGWIPTNYPTPTLYLPAPTSTGPIVQNTTPTLYDVRNCDINVPNPLNIKLSADVAIFAQSFDLKSGAVISSADGQPHKLWIMVPWGSGADGKSAKTVVIDGVSVNYNPGTINFASGVTVDPLISIFMYTPETLSYPSTSVTYGQMYASKVTVGGGSGKFYYTAMGVPGVDLSIPTSTAVGYRVEIVSKREMHD